MPSLSRACGSCTRVPPSNENPGFLYYPSLCLIAHLLFYFAVVVAFFFCSRSVGKYEEAAVSGLSKIKLDQGLS